MSSKLFAHAVPAVAGVILATLLASCSSIGRLGRPGPAAQPSVPQMQAYGAYGRPVNEFDILRMRIMERMAGPTQGGSN